MTPILAVTPSPGASATPSSSPVPGFFWRHRNLEDVTGDPLWVFWTIVAVAVLLVLVVLASKRWHREPTVIADEPISLFHYLAETVRKHWFTYVAFCLLPLIVGMVFEVNIVNIVAFCAFLVGALGAFYATRADVSAKAALNEATRTYNAVVEFADNL